MKVKRVCGGALLGVLFFAANAEAKAIGGRVYVDENRNGSAEADEAGVAGVTVSDGRQVVRTDTAGNYQMETRDTTALVWVCVPRDHQPAASFWKRVEGVDQRYDFGLVRHPQPDDFVFVQITDAHIGRGDLLRQFAERIARYPVACAFVVNTGDLVGGVDVVKPDKAQAQYDRYREAASAFSVPSYHVPGNHEHVAINVAEADKKDPRYGKGLYRQVFGPTYYSWDWAGVHCLALDGTQLPYREMLGQEQLVWLAEDLRATPLDKPVMLFCHQALFSLADVKELTALLRERNVLGAFCGHLHRTFTEELAGFPVYMSGALSGAWWSGPNIDGTPQGFRLAQVKKGVLKSVYGGREGATPVSVVAPVATAVRSNVMEVAVAVVDFGQAVEVTASYEGNPVQMLPFAREEMWSLWRGTVDTRLAFDGSRVFKTAVRSKGESVTNELRYLVVNGREEPCSADTIATLRLQVRGIDAPDVVRFNGEPLAVIPANTPKETTLAFEVGKEQLKKVNRVTIGAAQQGAGKDSFSVGPVALEYAGKKIHDLRYASFERFTLVGDDPRRCEKELFFCLP